MTRFYTHTTADLVQTYDFELLTVDQTWISNPAAGVERHVFNRPVDMTTCIWDVDGGCLALYVEEDVKRAYSAYLESQSKAKLTEWYW